MFKELAEKLGKGTQETRDADRKYAMFIGRFANWLESAGYVGQPAYAGGIMENDRMYLLFVYFSRYSLNVKVAGDDFRSNPGIDEFWEFNISRKHRGAPANIYMHHEKTEFPKGEAEKTVWGDYRKGSVRGSRVLGIPQNEDVFKAFEDVLSLNPSVIQKARPVLLAHSFFAFPS